MFDFVVACWLAFSIFSAWRNHQARQRQNQVIDELQSEIRRLAQLITRQQSLELVDAAPGEQTGFLEEHYGNER